MTDYICHCGEELAREDMTCPSCKRYRACDPINHVASAAKEISIKTIILQNGIEVIVASEALRKCSGCGKDILWSLTKNHKPMPISQLGDGSWVSHFFDCSKAKSFRKHRSLHDKIANGDVIL
jgi:hypothetical protein